MENKLTVIEKKEDMILNTDISRVKVRHKTKKRKKRLGRLLILIVIVAVTVAITKNFSKIKEYVFSFIPSFESNSSTNGSDISNKQENNEDLPGDTPENPSKPNTDADINTDENEENNKTENGAHFNEIMSDKLEFINESDYDTKNLLSTYQFPTAAEIYSKYGDDAPIVLLTNFSPKESYYSTSDSINSTGYYNDEQSVMDVASFIATELKRRGINAIHLVLPNSDQPLYIQRKAYENAINETIAKNPSISYVFDISRSIFLDDNGTPYAISTEVDGATVPTVSFTYGTDASKLTEARKNSISFGHDFTNYMNSSSYFVSCETVSKYTLSQSFSALSMRVDIGSYACTYDQAIQCAKQFADCLAEYIK